LFTLSLRISGGRLILSPLPLIYERNGLLWKYRPAIRGEEKKYKLEVT